jgi:AraC-like DNA-binding protein
MIKQNAVDKFFFIELLSQMIRETGRQGIYWEQNVCSHHSPVLKYTHVNSWSRIMIKRRKLLFCLPGGAFQAHIPKESKYDLLTISYSNKLIRFLYEEDIDKLYWYHTVKPINHVGRGVLDALSIAALNSKPDSRKIALLLNALIEYSFDQLKEEAPVHYSKSFNSYQQALNYIASNLHNGINRNSIARDLKITPQHLSRLFAMYSKEGFNATLKKYRLKYAHNLLQTGLYSVNEIADLSGHANVGYFITEFKKAFGFTPGKFPRD